MMLTNKKVKKAKAEETKGQILKMPNKKMHR